MPRIEIKTNSDWSKESVRLIHSIEDIESALECSLSDLRTVEREATRLLHMCDKRVKEAKIGSFLQGADAIDRQGLVAGEECMRLLRQMAREI